MKTTKLTLDKFAANALSKNEKRNILGKGDGIFLEVQEVYDVVILTSSSTSLPTDPPPSGTTPPGGTTPPSGGKDFGDGRMCYPIKL